MNESLFFILLLLLMFSPVILILGIAFGANASRNRKRRQIQESLPASVKYQAPVRLNSKKAHHRFWKFKGFEFSGILYVLDNRVYIKGTKGQEISYDLSSVVIKWEGVNAKNGLIEWFSIVDNHTEIYYINGETGTLVFALGKKKYPPTSEIYSSVLGFQQMAKMPPPNPAR